MGSDIVALLISMHMGAEKMGTYEKREFVNGCKILQCDSIATWKAHLPKLYQELENEKQFAKVYKFTYKFAANANGFRTIDLETAIALWDLLVTNKSSFLQQWKDFLKSKKDQNTISNDTWDLFLSLIETTKGSIANFEDDGAWPSLIDEFVLFMSKK